MSKPIKNADTGKWEVEVNGDVYEFDNRKAARTWLEEGGPSQDETESEPEADEPEEAPEAPEVPAVEDDSDYASQAVNLINSASRGLSAKIRNIMPDLGKNETEILSHLTEDGMAQKDLVVKMQTGSSNVGNAICKLEDEELVESKRSRSDRRSFDIFLTEEGKVAKKEVVAKREAAVSEVFSGLDEEGMEQLVALLKKLK